jgi:hypothetical protein
MDSGPHPYFYEIRKQFINHIALGYARE